jgi:hypothetical protein
MIKNSPHRLLFAVILVIVVGGDVFAQKYSIGVRAGGSVTWPGFGDKEAKEEFSRGFKFGYHAGILITFPLKDQFDLVLEGGASQKGRVLKFNDGEWRNNLTMRMADMGMHLRKNFTFMLKKDTPADAFVNLGPDINYWYGSEGKLVVNEKEYSYGIAFNEEPTSDYKTMYLNNVNQWIFGLAIGVGLKAPLGKNRFITTELRFVSGHTFLGKKETSYIEILGFQDTFKTNLKTLSLSVAYSIDFDVKQRRMGKSNIKKKLKR